MPRRFHLVFLLTLVVFSASPPAAAQENDPNLEAIGALTAAQLYTTYLYMGVTGDAFAKGVYSAKQVRAMMNEAEKLLANVSGYLDKVGKQNITESDRNYLTGALNGIDLLRAEAKALVRYAGTGTPEDASIFEQSRKAAYAQVGKLLGLPADK